MSTSTGMTHSPLPPLGAMTPQPPHSSRWTTWRSVLAAVGIVLISGGATAAIALNEVGRLVEALEQHKPIKLSPGVLAPAGRGEPETLLLVGNDERAQTPYYHDEVLPHSNEMLLVRIDPSQPTIAMLSIPRELKVPIDLPDGEVTENRINSAFTFGWEGGGGMAGGVKLMVKTIEQVLGLGVNHVFITNFHQFAKAVNAMGCVYMTVDKRYYHNNETEPEEQYFQINLQPGYQKLCGKEALQFVAARHESTSLIRDARDQRFLLEAKSEYGSSLVSNRERFEAIFGKYVESTLASEEEILQLLYLLIESAGKPVRQVTFQATLGVMFNGVSVDTATPEQIHEAVESFLSGTSAISRHGLSVAAHPASGHRNGTGGSLGFALTPTSASELAEARAQAPNLPFPLEYPRARDSYEGAEPDELRLYDIHDQQGHVHPIYAIVIDRGEVGQYYDVQGTNWTDPPLLRDPGQTVHVGKRTYRLFYVGEHIKTIAWREAGAVYWIENTLTNDVSPRVMLAIAEQTLPVIHTGSQPVAPSVAGSTPRNLNLAPHPAAATSALTRIGALLGFLGLALVGLLALVALARQRELRRLREQVSQALALEARGRPLLATAASSLSGPQLASHLQPAPAAASPAMSPSTAAPAVAGAQPASHAQPAPAAVSPATSQPSSEPPPPTIYRTPRAWRRVLPLAAAALVLAAALIAVAAHLLHL